MQQRARERREQILAAAAHCLEVRGYSATSTNAVATQAGVSIGTVYEYFPNKQALLHELLERYRHGLTVALAEAVAPQPEDDWWSVVERAFDAFHHYYRQEPGYRVLWLQSQLVDALLETGAAWSHQFSHQLAALLAPRALVGLDELVPVARAAIHIASALITTSLQHRDEALAIEAKVALRRYLAPAFDR